VTTVLNNFKNISDRWDRVHEERLNNLVGRSSLDGRGRPALSQNPKLRRRAPPGVRRGHHAGRPGPTRRLLSALRGVLLPFAHGFRRQRPRSSEVHVFEGRPMPRSICMLGSQRFFVKHLLSGRAGIKALRGGEYSLAGRALPATTFQRYASAPGLSHDGWATSLREISGRSAALPRRLRSADGEEALRRAAS
jgi:hypothetical protein